MRCNIIGTGNSLRGKDLELSGYTFGINHSYKYFNVDETVFYDNIPEFKDNAPNPQYLTIYGGQWRPSGSNLNLSDNCVSCVNISLFMAINVAIQRGFTDIHIYGCDNRLEEYVHFYDEDTVSNAHKAIYSKLFDRIDKILAMWKPQLKDYNLYFYDSEIKHFKNRCLG
jgi:hypothetical protein